jgi:hypothetical protein
VNLPDTLPRSQAVHAALDALVLAIDDAKHAGLTVAPMLAQGVATIGVGLVVLAGSEAEMNGQPSPFAAMHGPTILGAILPDGSPATLDPEPERHAKVLRPAFGGVQPSPIPPAFGGKPWNGYQR